MSKERKEKVWAPKFNTAMGVALQKQNDTEKLDSSILENHLQKEAAKEEYDQLKKLGGEWSNKYFRFGLKIKRKSIFQCSQKLFFVQNSLMKFQTLIFELTLSFGKMKMTF